MVYGDLLIENTFIRELPETLTHISGTLNTRSTFLSKLPDNLQFIGADFIIIHNNFKLPDVLYVGGNFIVADYVNFILPKKLYVNGSLNLAKTPLMSLDELPTDMIIGNQLVILDTPLSYYVTEEEIRNRCPHIKGIIMR